MALAEPLLASVVVPAYNGAHFLPRCLASLQKQTHPRVEIIVVDDGSTDGTPDLVQAPVRLLSTGGRKGAGAARNDGAKAAAGDVLFFTDADVVAPPPDQFFVRELLDENFLHRPRIAPAAARRAFVFAGR